jgi:small subunit ribosomal protein S9
MTTTKKPKPAARKAPAKKAAAHPAAPAKAAVHEEAHVAGGAYQYAVGRRKSGIAQVRVYPTGKGHITINRKPMKAYFPVDELQDAVLAPLKAVGMEATADVSVMARGGGIRGQADATKLGIARALLKVNPDFRATLKPLGVLTRDSREKERKKYGLKKARKAPQWAKR